MLLLAIGAWIAVRSRSKAWIPLAFGAAIFLSALFSQINIGLRHILPVFIAFSIVAAAGAVRLMGSARRWVAFGAASVFVWMAVVSASSHPDYLAYFNEFAGSAPEKIVVDSDLDWGQDVKRLAARLKELDAKEVTFATMLIANLDREHGFPHLVGDMDATRPNVGWNAISLTLLKTRRLGLMDAYPNVQLWPDRIPPREKVGKGILLYYFPPR
jgi:hypothetical protein